MSLIGAIDPKKAYAILENLVTQGFDAVGVRMGGFSLVLKTMSSREEKMMTYLYPDGITKDVYLAWSTFLLEGKNMLAERSGGLRDLTAFYASLPAVVVEKLFAAQSKLQDRSYLSSAVLGGYAVSARSRELWGTFGKDLNRERVTGIEGTENLGLNSVQEAWVSFNRALDDEERERAEMHRAYFIASAMSPKGVEKASLSAEGREKNKQEERMLMVKFGSLANRDIIMDIRKPVADGWAPKIETTKDLLRELEKQMRGEKDRHDLFVDSFFKGLEEEAAAQEKAEELRRKEVFKHLDPESIFQGQAAVSTEEMERAMRGEVDIRDIIAGRKLFGAEQSTGKVGRRVIR